jgi:hypothetical protein
VCPAKSISAEITTMKNIETQSLSSSHSESESYHRNTNKGDGGLVGSGGAGDSSDNNSTNSISTGDSPRSSTILSTCSNNNSNRAVELARKETESVNRLRYIVLVILILVSIGVSLLVYYITKQTDEEEMTSQFETASARLVDAFDGIRTERIATLASLAIAAIAHGKLLILVVFVRLTLGLLLTTIDVLVSSSQKIP